ncbi:MAG: rhodanese-like domain-containing protein [Sulfurimonadaceae bacterium]
MSISKTCLSLVASAITATALFSAETTANQHKHMFSESVKVLTVSDLTNRSNDDYALNNYGVVSAEKAAAWITDWKHNRPAGISGKLFVMQVGDIYGDAHNYIKHNDVDTFTFDRTAGCTTSGDFRNDGVSNVPKPVFSGQQMDDAFMAYNIDPKHDMFLLVLAEGDSAYYAGSVRMWYTLAYWGVPQENIAVMNGQASHVLNPEINTNLQSLGINSKDDIFVANQSVPPMNGTHSISEIKRDGTILQATTGDMMELVAGGAENATIIDARSEAEYFGSKKAKTEFTVCGADGASQCYTAFDGHIKGAQNIYYTDVVNTKDGSSDINGDGVIDGKDATYSFKDIYEIESIFADAGYSEGQTAYIYCRTGTKASLLTFTSAAVLGYPTRMYDGSWIQWGKLADAIDTNGNQLLPSDSTWRVDTADYSESITYNTDSAKVSPHAQGSLHLENSSTNAIINEDKVFKLLK